MMGILYKLHKLKPAAPTSFEENKFKAQDKKNHFILKYYINKNSFKLTIFSFFQPFLNISG